jgi:outer membrane lipopolysaccharide assembly protein LptE/RlpB
MTIETLDAALDLLLLSLLIFGVALVLRIHLATGVAGGAVARVVRRIVSSTERLEAASEAIDTLHEEMHEQAIAAIDRRLKALEDHLGNHQSKTDK